MDPKLLLLAVVTFCFGFNDAFGQSCDDKLSHCGSWPKDYCQTYYEYMKLNCARFCGHCPGTTPAPVCDDKSSYCNVWKNAGFCAPSSIYHNYMKTNCRKSCGFCGTPTTPVPTTTNPTTGPTQPSGSCGSASQKLQGCSFDSDTCDFVDVPFDDSLDFKLTSSGGQDNRGYIKASGSGEAQMILPLELLVPHNGDHGNMCMEFYYRMGARGSLKIQEVRNAKNYPKTAELSLSGGQNTWKRASFTFRASQYNHLLIRASPNSGWVDIDSVRFCDGSCS